MSSLPSQSCPSSLSSTEPDHIRALISLAALLAATLPADAFACSCWGTQSIGDALSNADVVVLGRVMPRPRTGEDLLPMMSAPVTVEVLSTLKGDVPTEIRVSAYLMCYQSFDVRDFKNGETFVFALDSYDAGKALSTIPESQARDLYLLPLCSHTALAVRDGQLYTNELSATGGRQLEYYLPLVLVRFLLPLGLLSFSRIVLWVLFILIVLAAVDIVRRSRQRRRRINASTPGS